MKHLSLSARIEIEAGLRRGESLKRIAQKLGVARSTVMREIKKRSVSSDKGAKGRLTNRCVNRSTCSKKFRCSSCNRPWINRKCSTCPRCNDICPNFVELKCELLDNSPYVCNGCAKEGICVLRKRYYIAEVANQSYRNTLKTSREGAAITLEELEKISYTISSSLKKGQSLNHIMHANPDDFNVCERTLYTYINNGILTDVGILDLPKAASIRPKRKKSTQHKINTRCKDGRGLTDFQKFCNENKDIAPVEMDSVIGNVGGKVLLTFQFDYVGLMLAFIRDHNTSQSVIDIFDSLEQNWGLEKFRQVFPVILTDNGSEFSNPDALERSINGKDKRTFIFYCDPYSSWQKPNVENNHLNLRKFFPKGKSMDNLTQDKVNIALSHLNSMLRKSLGNVPAITKFNDCYGERLLQAIGINLIEPNRVIIDPKVLN